MNIHYMTQEGYLNFREFEWLNIVSIQIGMDIVEPKWTERLIRLGGNESVAIAWRLRELGSTIEMVQ